MSDRLAPEWLRSAPYWYYTHIEMGSPDVVTVRRAAADQLVSDRSPGTPVLRLHPHRGTTPIFAGDGLERGSIRPEGIFRGLRFVMRREGTPVWVLTVRSFVRKRHRLEIIDGDVWTFDMPFFLRRHLTGTVSGHERLLGRVGPTMRHWGFSVDADRETVDFLAAVAFMHWKWWCW
jgi:hypothetical protein